MSEVVRAFGEGSDLLGVSFSAASVSEAFQVSSVFV